MSASAPVDVPLPLEPPLADGAGTAPVPQPGAGGPDAERRVWVKRADRPLRSAALSAGVWLAARVLGVALQPGAWDGVQGKVTKFTEGGD